jgi:hypothetical protein
LGRAKDYERATSKFEKKDIVYEIVTEMEGQGGVFLCVDKESGRYFRAPMGAVVKETSRAVRETWKQETTKKKSKTKTNKVGVHHKEHHYYKSPKLSRQVSKEQRRAIALLGYASDRSDATPRHHSLQSASLDAEGTAVKSPVRTTRPFGGSFHHPSKSSTSRSTSSSGPLKKKKTVPLEWDPSATRNTNSRTMRQRSNSLGATRSPATTMPTPNAATTNVALLFTPPPQPNNNPRIAAAAGGNCMPTPSNTTYFGSGFHHHYNNEVSRPISLAQQDAGFHGSPQKNPIIDVDALNDVDNHSFHSAPTTLNYYNSQETTSHAGGGVNLAVIGYNNTNNNEEESPYHHPMGPVPPPQVVPDSFARRYSISSQDSSSYWSSNDSSASSSSSVYSSDTTTTTTGDGENYAGMEDDELDQYFKAKLARELERMNELSLAWGYPTVDMEEEANANSQPSSSGPLDAFGSDPSGSGEIPLEIMRPPDDDNNSSSYFPCSPTTPPQQNLGNQILTDAVAAADNWDPRRRQQPGTTTAFSAVPSAILQQQSSSEAFLLDDGGTRTSITEPSVDAISAMMDDVGATFRQYQNAKRVSASSDIHNSPGSGRTCSDRASGIMEEEQLPSVGYTTTASSSNDNPVAAAAYQEDTAPIEQQHSPILHDDFESFNFTPIEDANEAITVREQDGKKVFEV